MTILAGLGCLREAWLARGPGRGDRIAGAVDFRDHGHLPLAFCRTLMLRKKFSDGHREGRGGVKSLIRAELLQPSSPTFLCPCFKGPAVVSARTPPECLQRLLSALWGR